MQPQSVTFWEWFTSLDTGDLAGLSILLVLGVVGVIIVLSSLVYLMHKNRLHDSLKRELLDRGFGAEEIALIVYGKSRTGAGAPDFANSRQKVQVKQ